MSSICTASVDLDQPTDRRAGIGMTVNRMETVVTMNSIIALSAIVGAFVGFAGFLLYGDLTWRGRFPNSRDRQG